MGQAVMTALVNGVLSLIGWVLNPELMSSPAPTCDLDVPGIASSFLNFSCDLNVSITDMELVNSYLECILGQVKNNFTGSDTFATCPNMTDVNAVSAALANCYWCTSTGCFQIGGPFISNCNPISLPPQPPSCLHLQLLLYTPSNTYNNNPQELSANLSNIASSNFDFQANTSILIPGFLALDYPFAEILVPAILNCSKQNVVVLNWGLASNPPYAQALANARSAAITVANFVRALNDEYNYSPSKVHLIGHSLGGQLAGFVGEAYPSIIGRITGLDPAGPSFNCDPQVRLDPTDAVFVDVIHSNSGFFGIVDNLGDVDFWPNGGSFQPACNSSVITQNNKTSQTHLPCDHMFSISFYASSMRFCEPAFNCSFEANMCANYSDFQQGECNSCGTDGSRCAQMGYFAQNYAWAGYPLPAPQAFYLNTANTTPYCTV